MQRLGSGHLCLVFHAVGGVTGWLQSSLQCASPQHMQDMEWDVFKALNASHVITNALTCHQAVPMQRGPRGSCRQWLPPVYTRVPPPPPELVLDPEIIYVYQLFRCMETAGGTGVLHGCSPVPARWRCNAVLSPDSTSTCLVHGAGAGRAANMSVLCSGARSTPSCGDPWSAPLGWGPRGAGLAEDMLSADTAHASLQSRAPNSWQGWVTPPT